MNRVGAFTASSIRLWFLFIVVAGFYTDPAMARTDAIWIAPAQAERKGPGGPGQAHQNYEGHGEDSKQQSGRPLKTGKAEVSGRSGRPTGSGSHGGHGGHGVGVD